MKSLFIFGDSFSADNSSESWSSLLSGDFNVVNYSNNGSSEYRIWKEYQTHKSKIKETDTVLFCHTSPSRIYLKDSVVTSSRNLKSHPSCDLIFEDIYSKKEKEFIQILETVWDDDYFNDCYNLLINDLLTVPNSIHITFFDVPNVHSFNHIWQTNRGNINHLSSVGNYLIANELKKSWLCN